VPTIASHCTRPKDGSVIHSARGTRGRVTGVLSPEPHTQQPCGLTGRFELNGEMSRTDVASDTTAQRMNPRSPASRSAKEPIFISSLEVRWWRSRTRSSVQTNKAAADDRIATALIEECMSMFGRLDILINCAGISEPPGSSILESRPKNSIA
jgi:hypothetical protein